MANNKKINNCYREFLRYKYHARKPKATLGNHAAMRGLKFPLMENTDENLPTKI